MKAITFSIFHLLPTLVLGLLQKYAIPADSGVRGAGTGTKTNIRGKAVLLTSELTPFGKQTKSSKCSKGSKDSRCTPYRLYTTLEEIYSYTNTIFIGSGVDGVPLYDVLTDSFVGILTETYIYTGKDCVVSGTLSFRLTSEGSYDQMTYQGKCFK
jgi:hypothetical protein